MTEDRNAAAAAEDRFYKLRLLPLVIAIFGVVAILQGATSIGIGLAIAGFGLFLGWKPITKTYVQRAATGNS